MFEIERLSVHCIYLCKRWALILEKNATHYWAMCPFLLYLSEVNMRPEVLWNVKFCAIHFAKLLTRFSFSEQVHCQSKHPVEQALPSIYDSAGGRFPRQASNFVKQSSNSNMKHHEENVLDSENPLISTSEGFRRLALYGSLQNGGWRFSGPGPETRKIEFLHE